MNFNVFSEAVDYAFMKNFFGGFTCSLIIWSYYENDWKQSFILIFSIGTSWLQNITLFIIQTWLDVQNLNH